jgi:hypothetical protein
MGFCYDCYDCYDRPLKRHDFSPRVAMTGSVTAMTGLGAVIATVIAILVCYDRRNAHLTGLGHSSHSSHSEFPPYA